MTGLLNQIEEHVKREGLNLLPEYRRPQQHGSLIDQLCCFEIEANEPTPPVLNFFIVVVR